MKPYRCRPTTLLFVLLTAHFVAGAAYADDLQSTRGQKIIEHDHHVDIELHDGYALYKIRRSFSTTGKKPEQMRLDIEVPEGATASNLAILAQGTWHKAELLEASEARRKYKRLTGFGAAPVKDPAILYWRSRGSLGLQIFPIQSEKSWIEYSLVVPVRFQNGLMAYDYPKVAPLQKDEQHRYAPIHVSVLKGHATVNINSLRLDSKRISLKQKRTLPRVKHNEDKRDDLVSTLTLAPKAPFQLAPRFAKIEVAGDRDAIWTDIHVGQLSALPQNAKVVFVLDASISVGGRGLFRQSQVVRATASHFPKSTRFAVVTFARTAQKHSNGFVAHRGLKSLLQKAQSVGRQNGSEITAGVAMAADILATQKGPKRIVLVSDNMRRLTTPEDALQKAIGDSGALLHIVAIPPHRKIDDERDMSGQPVLLQEIEETFWSEGVQNTGGIVVRMNSPDWKYDGLRKETLHLVRPTKVKDLRFERAKKGTSTFRMSKEDSLRLRELPDVVEGEQHRIGFGVDKNEIAPVLHGRLWSKPISWPMKTSDAYNKVSGGFLITLGQSAWTPFETMTLARHSHVVSPVTSLIAAEPGARPSRDGFGTGGVGLGGGGAGLGGWGTGALRTSQMVMTSWNHILDKERDACAQKNESAGDWTFYFVLQRGLLEIVDVQPLRNPAQKVSGLQTCLYEAIWNYRLKGSEPEPDIVFLSSR